MTEHIHLSSKEVMSLQPGEELLITMRRGEIRVFAVKTANTKMPIRVIVRSVRGKSNTYRAVVRGVVVQNSSGTIVRVPWIVFTYERQRVGMARGAWAQRVESTPNPEGDIVMKKLQKRPRKRETAL